MFKRFDSLTCANSLVKGLKHYKEVFKCLGKSITNGKEEITAIWFRCEVCELTLELQKYHIYHIEFVPNFRILSTLV